MSLFVSRKFASYIDALERELQTEDRTYTINEKAQLYANIAAAQLELGLNRKCLKSCDESLLLVPGKRNARAMLLKGKALSASGRVTEAVQLWNHIIADDDEDDADGAKQALLVDVVVIAESLALIRSTEKEAAAAVDSIATSTTIDTVYSNDTNDAAAADRVVTLAATEKKTTVDTEDAVDAATSSMQEEATATVSVIPRCSDTLIEEIEALKLRNDLENDIEYKNHQQQQKKKQSSGNDLSTKLSAAKSSKNVNNPPANVDIQKQPAKIAAATTAATTTTTTAVTSKKPNSASQQVQQHKHTTAAANTAVLETLRKFHRMNIGSSEKHAIKPFFLTTMRGNLPHICGEEIVDDLVCVAYININSGHYDFAIDVFHLLFAYRDNVPSAHIGLGSIFALRRQLEVAIDHFSYAIELDDSIADSWKRRGQTRAAKGLLKLAIEDLTRAAELEPDVDVYYQRALVHHQSRNFMRALFDFNTARKKGLCNGAIMNYIGMCEGQIGSAHESLTSHALAVTLDPHFKEAFLNIALGCKELGRQEAAEKAFAVTFAVAQYDNTNAAPATSTTATAAAKGGAAVQQNQKVQPPSGFDAAAKLAVDGKNAPNFAVLVAMTALGKNESSSSLQQQQQKKQKSNQPPFLQAHSHRGMFNYSLGKPGAALKDFTIVVNALYAAVLRATPSVCRTTSEADGFEAEGLQLPTADSPRRTSSSASAAVVAATTTGAAEADPASVTDNTATMESTSGSGITITKRAGMIQDLVKAAMCCQSLGQCNKAAGFLDRVLAVDPGHNCWFLREIYLTVWNLLDSDIESFSLDSKIDPRLKDGWCKQVPWHGYMSSSYLHVQSSQPVSSAVAMSPAAAAVLATGKYPLATKPTQILTVQRCSRKPYTDEDDDVFPASQKAVLASGLPIGVQRGMNKEVEKIQLLLMSSALGSFIQLNSPGFLPNRRQQRMFGLAVLQMTIALKKHFELIGLEGIGLAVPDAASSRASNDGSSNACTSPSGRNITSTNSSSGSSVGSSGKRAPSSSATSSSGGGSSGSSSSATASRSLSGSLTAPISSSSSSGKRGAGATTHPLGWRDLFDISVRWRQVSEPGDPVWWIDRFPLKAFNEGFGLQTPLINGQLKTVRYSPYFAPAFQRLKELLLSDGFYTANDQLGLVESSTAVDKIKKAKSLNELYNLVGVGNFYVVIPCPSVQALNDAADATTATTIAAAGTVPALMGTRLTLVLKEPEGYEFTIRTPGKPHRWIQYESELDRSFHKLEELFLQQRQQRSTAEFTLRADSSDDEAILRRALEMFYLWATFAPLSRGTAACGYAGLFAVLLAYGKLLLPATVAATGDAAAELRWITSSYSGTTRPCSSSNNNFSNSSSSDSNNAEVLLSVWPEGKQLDWEAILAKDFNAFWETAKRWFALRDVTLLPKSMPLRKVLLEAGSEYHRRSSSASASSSRSSNASGVFSCIKTLRDMFDMMALPY